MAEDDVVVTYDALREVQRSERRSEKLFDMDDRFYLGVKNYLESREKATDDMKDIELRNANNILKDLTDRRERKILNLACQVARSSKSKIKLDNMTNKEKELFEKLVDVIKEYRVDIAQASKDIKPEDIPKEEEPKNDEEEDESEENEPEKESKTFIKVKILEEIPEIVGADMKNYGPFKADEEVELPEENANIFIENNKAEKI
jgi:DNA replication factor GINS